ncbi:MAG: hypothetical protein KatS3mg031_1331 [Chitinophagales bacterium]|nr:MAG: hypothetical protein KatS3mg031_1331 [Chitinophagales bacterium]
MRVLRFATNLLIITFLSAPLSGCRLITVIQFEKAKKLAPYEVIIVPGFPYDDLDGKEKMNIVHRIRILWAYYLYQERLTQNIIFSGGAVYTPYTEAGIMAQYAYSLGIPPENIFQETRAEHSTENLFYGYALARNLGFEKIAIATDPFQTQLIKRNTRQDQLPVYYLPAKVSMLLRKFKDLDPVVENPEEEKVSNFTPLNERLTSEERKRGTQGERFRSRYNLIRVTVKSLEELHLYKK